MNERELPVGEHAHGCPAGRTESYPVRRADGSDVVVVRCLDCGGQAIYEKGDDHE